MKESLRVSLHLGKRVAKTAFDLVASHWNCMESVTTTLLEPRGLRVTNRSATRFQSVF